MKKVFSVVTAFVLIFAMFAASNANVQAENTCTTDSVVYVHYHRWDGLYDGTYIHTWGSGTNGSSGDVPLHSVDNFGAVYEICVNSTDASNELGLINKYSAAWGDGFNDRDAVDTDDNGNKDGNHKLIPIGDGAGTLDGFDENGIKHVYVFEGSNQVITDNDENSMPYVEDKATIALIYYDPSESYDEWNVWSFGNGSTGTKADPIPDSDTGLLWRSQLGVDGGNVENFRVLFINVDTADMAEKIGFIVRTNSWEKKYPENIEWSTEDLETGDFVTLFYIAGEANVRETFEDFEATVNFFEISSSQALDPNSVEVVFNKDVVTAVNDVITFDETAFTLTDKDGAEVAIDSVSFNSTTDVNDTFTLILEDALSGDMGPYTVTYTTDMAYTSEFAVDNVDPVITIIGSTNVELELGDTYSLPTYTATDTEGEETVQIYTVRVKDGHGTVDTRNAGIYEVVIEANDKFGNATEKTITVTVMDPCDPTAHLSAEITPTVQLAALFVGLPLVLGVAVVVRRRR